MHRKLVSSLNCKVETWFGLVREPGRTDRKQLVVVANYSLTKANFRYAPHKWSVEGTVRLSHRLGENHQLSRFVFCTKRPNSAAGV